MEGMTFDFARPAGSVVEFDLTLERPGRWILRSRTLPDAGIWYGRQADAISYAGHRAGTCETLIVRLHNEWDGVKYRR